jgi:hypothetical protein
MRFHHLQADFTAVFDGLRSAKYFALFSTNIFLPTHLCSATFLANLICRRADRALDRNEKFNSKFGGNWPVLTLDSKVVWYGKLKVGSKETPVLYDPQIVPSIKGCIYLYNSERDAIVQYTWNIVQGLLVDLDKAEKVTVKKAIDAKWKAARKKFTKGQVIAFSSQQEESTPALSPESAARRWDATDNDSFELEDLG